MGSRERSRGRAAGGATGRRALRGYEGRTETPLQNSQRVLLAKPRTAPVARRAMWRGGAMGTSRPTAMRHGRCARQRDTSVGRGGAMRTSRPTAMRHGRCARQRDTSVVRGGAMRTSRPTAMPHKRGARWGRGARRMERGDGTRAVRTATGHERCARQRDTNVVRGGAMRTSRPTATGHGRGVHATGHGRGARRGAQGGTGGGRTQRDTWDRGEADGEKRKRPAIAGLFHWMGCLNRGVISLDRRRIRRDDWRSRRIRCVRGLRGVLRRS